MFMGTQLFAGGGRQAPADGRLNVMMWTRDIADFANMQYYRELEEATGIPINLNAIDGSEWSTRVNLMFASGDYPDVILRGGIEVEQFGVDQGILIPLDDIIERYMPNYRALLNRDPSLRDLMRASDGNTYYTGFLLPQNINVEGHLFINQAWLNQLGLPVPTTLAQFENTLRAFRDRIPNSIPFTGTWGGYESIFQFLSFWGIPYHGSWLHINDDHRVVSQLQHQNFRTAIETLSRWYNEGLIDVEVLTLDWRSYEARINSGNVGTLWRWRMMAMGTPDNIVEQYVGILPITAISGVRPQVRRLLELPSRGAYITTAARDVERVARWIDAQYEFEMMANGYYGPFQLVNQGGNIIRYGWEIAPNGRVDFHTGDVESIPNQSAIHFFSGVEYFERFNMPPQRVEKTDLSIMYTNAGMVETNSGQILQDLITMSPADMDRRDLLSAQINTFVNESLNNFITSGVTDASWNTFQATLQNLRLDELIRIHQTAYDRFRAARR